MSRRFLLYLFLACLGLALSTAASLRFGAAQISLDGLLSQSQGILMSRTFRTICALMVGAALAISGLMLQALTRNALADPGITGINAGAALCAISLAYFAPELTGAAPLLAASFGAVLCGCALWYLAGGAASDGLDSLALRLPLAGLAIEALCLSLASALILTDSEMQARYLHWISGAVPTVSQGELPALVVIAILLATGFFLCERLELLSLGAQHSASLGRRPRHTIFLVLAHVTFLSGASVAVIGPLAFLGLLVPFVSRTLAEGNIRHAYVIALPLGSSALLIADTIGRVIARPGEVEAGVIAALIGGPTLIVVLRQLLPARSLR